MSNEQQTTKPSGTKSEVSVGEVQLAMRTLLTGQAIQAAARFAQLSCQVESSNISSELKSDHRSYVLGAITFSAIFLESTINELFLNAGDPKLERHPDPHVEGQLKASWATGIDKLPPLDKFQIALLVAGKEPLDKGKQPYQLAKLLVELRNALVHYKPEWVRLDDQTKWEKKLDGKFEPCEFLKGSNNPFFPDKCLSCGCAKWAVNASWEFVEGFNARMGLPPPKPILENNLRLPLS